MGRRKSKIAELEDEGYIQLQGVQLPMGKLPDQFVIHHPAALFLRDTPRPSLWWFDARSANSHIYDRKSHSMEGCLYDFCRLYNAPDAKILSFAQKWGVLGIWPGRYEVCLLEPEARALYRDAPQTFPEWQKHFWYAETTEMWRKISAHFRNLLFIGAKVQRGEHVPPRDWAEVVEIYGDANFCLPQSSYTELHATSQMLEYYNRFPADTSVWVGFSKALAEGIISDNQIQKIALRDAIERWTKQITMSAQIEYRQAGQWYLPVVVPVVDKPTIDGSERYWKLCEMRNIPEPYALQPEPDLTKTYVFDLNVISPMCPSILMNVLVVQLVAALASPLAECIVCKGLFGQKHGKETMCSDECRMKRDRNRARGKYVPVSQRVQV